MKRRILKKQQSRRFRQARAWMRRHVTKYDYGRGFDLAVDCAYDLDLCEYCEVNGDKTFIPIWLVQLAETFYPEGES